ncbi:MAG: hypothetical protein RL333_22 [Pseudomonadota bacterium]
MAEVREESTHVWSSQPRIAAFLSAMRHFRARIETMGWPIEYRELDDPENRGTLVLELADVIQRLAPSALIMTAPGDWRVLQGIKRVARDHALSLDIRDDRTFFSTVREFVAFSKGRKQLRMEYWYRNLRKQHDILMDGEAPVGGQWNFDADNRKSFDKAGPQALPQPLAFRPDALTQSVLALVQRAFPDHPGSLNSFAWPMTPEEAQLALDDFLAHRLALFGPYEDAMWQGEPWLYHSQLSMALNLKLLSAREVVKAVEARYREGQVSLASAEGFIRQILGWREYVRGIYWTQMPAYQALNALEASRDLPHFFWTGVTPMRCLSECLTQSLALGYAHHIQRLMVIGLYALLFGVKPESVHQWFLAVYVDAVEWVELPNTLGMGQFGDGGYMASKPYVASGQYIQRMSNYCQSCDFDPKLRVGEKACPFTTLYWDFLIRHQARLASNPRMGMQLKNLAGIPSELQAEIQTQAYRLREPSRVS